MKLILTLAYLSMFGESNMETYDYSAYGMEECRRVAAEWKIRIKAGSGSAWCKYVIAIQP